MKHFKYPLTVVVSAAILSAAAGQPAVTTQPTNPPAGQPKELKPVIKSIQPVTVPAGQTPPGIQPGGSAPIGAPGTQHAQPTPVLPPREPKAFKWTDADAQKVGSSIAGTWKTTGAVAQGDKKDQKTDVVMTIAPVAIDGIPNAEYVEVARADSPWAPYSQSIFQFYKHKGQLRLRTLKFHLGADGKPNTEFVGGLVGQWAIPEYFTDVTSDNLIGTLDLDVKTSGSGFTAKTPYPYPTATGGAVEMTSEFTFDGKTITTADRGYDADGKVVWGSSEGDKYTFTKAEPVAKVIHKDDGLVVLVYKEGTEGKSAEKDDQLSMQFTGWLVGNGKQFDSTRRGNRPPMSFKQGALIEGLNQGLLGLKNGARVHVIIPPKLAYAENGKGQIPGNAWLHFDIELVSVQPPAAPPAAPTTPAGPGPAGPAITPPGAHPAPATPPPAAHPVDPAPQK